MRRLALLLAPLLLIVGLVTAPAAQASVRWSMCYGSGIGTTCHVQYVYSTRNPTWAVPDTSSYRLTFQTDCNLVFYDPGYANGVSWSTGTYSIPRPCTLKWQTDGNVVIYDSGNHARWSSHTNYGGNTGYIMRMNDIGQLWIDQGTTHRWCNHPGQCTYQ